MKKLFHLLFALLLTAHTATGQMTKWILNPNEIDFAAGTASSLNTGASNPYKVENAVYKEGVLQFYANDGKVYNALGNYVGQFAGDPAAMLKEVAVAPGPGTCNTWCLFWLETSPLATLTFHYQEVRVENGDVSFGVSGTFTNPQFAGNDGGIAVSHVLPGTQADRDIYVINFSAVRRFRLSATGVTLQQTVSLGGLSGSGFIAEADLSPDGKYLTWNKENRIIVMETSPLGLFNSITIGSSSSTIYGLEFSDDGNYIYVCHSTLGIRRWTFTGAEVEALSESNTYNNTQLELARDGNIYAVRNDGVLGIIQGLSVQESPLGIKVFSNQPAPASNNYYALPDQVDGEDYSSFYGIPVVTVNSMSVNSSPLTADCASPLSVYNCNPILFNATYNGGTPGSYMLEIQAVNSTCALVTGPGFLNFQSGWTAGAPPANLNLATLTDQAGLNLGNSTGKFKITLTVRNGCRIERSAFGYLLVNGPPTPASVSLTINSWTVPGVPQPPATSPPGVSSGAYSASFNLDNSTGYITYYTIQIQQVDCATGAFIRDIYPATTTNVPGSLSSLVAVPFNVLEVPAIPALGWAGGQGFFAAHALGNCYLVTVTAGNPCSMSSAFSYLRFNCTCFNGGGNEDRSSEEDNIPQPGIKLGNSFKVFPNPVASLLTFDYTVKKEGKVTVIISDETGRTVFSEIFFHNENTNRYTFDTKDLKTGLYLYRFITPAAEYTGKFLKVER